MRIHSLLLQRYGPFTDRHIDLSDPSVRLWVFLGPNEAGKSTVLRAIEDWLYGFGHRTNADFLHPMGALRVGGTLCAASGATLTCLRRKGIKNLLLTPDASETPLPEDSLAPFLGGVSQEQFSSFYGLDHQGLRASGEALLQAKGDAGQILFHAAGGERAAMGLLAQLKKEADELFTERAVKSKPFHREAEAIKEARRQLQAGLVKGAEWKETQERLRQAEQTRSDLLAQQETLGARRSRLERIRRLRQPLAELRRVEEELPPLLLLPALPEEALERYHAARAQLTLKENALLREEAELTTLTDQLAALPVRAGILELTEEITALHERRGAIRKAMEELPGVRQARQQTVDVIHSLLREMGSPHAPESAQEHLPSATTRAAIQARLEQWSELHHRLEEGRKAVAEAAAATEQGRERLARLPTPPEEGGLAPAMAAARNLRITSAHLEQLSVEAQEAQRQADALLAALPLWRGEGAALAALPVPSPETLHRLQREEEELRTLRTARSAAVAAARTQADEARAGLERLTAREGHPVVVDVATARRQRDALWQRIRARLEPAAAPDATPAGELQEAFQAAMAEADRLADRQLAEAARQERLSHGVAALERSQRLLEQAQDGLNEAQEQQRQWESRWQAVWHPCQLLPLPPPEMTAWLRQREQALAALELARRKAAEATAAQAAWQQAVTALRAALSPHAPELTADAGLEPLLQRGEALQKQWTAQRARRQTMEQEQERLELAWRTARHQQEATEEARQAWEKGWEQEIPRLGLPPRAAPAEAKSALALWERCGTALHTLAEQGRRIDTLEEEVRLFSQQARRCLERIGASVTGEAPLEGVGELFKHLQQAQADAKRRDELTQRQGEIQAHWRALSQQRDEARDTLQALMDQAGCDLEALPARLEQGQRRSRLLKEREELQGKIARESDGLSLEQVKQELGAEQAATVESELAQLDEGWNALPQQREQVGQEIHALQTALEQMAVGRGAAEANQSMKNATAALEEIGRRWLVLQGAQQLLFKGLERFRGTRQGGMLARASACFARLTLGAFRGVRLEYGAGDHPRLLGERANGEGCPPEGMSDGTRDQLFLALRLAALEERLGEGEPLPFVADDLFVHFDDARSRAGMEAMLALGEHTQVLFFTHHRQVAEAALEIAPAGVARRVEL